uniref:Uncharacterized protein n=1 Tax=Caenorhabditis tropicalis TaxID=1561998 RepID=A0A1I7T8S3_9PELO
MEKKETKTVAPSAQPSSSVFSLPTNEDELKIKKWEQENDVQLFTPSSSTSSSFESNKRKLPVETPDSTSQRKELPKKRKMVILTRDTLPDKYQKAIEIPTSELTKNMSYEDQKQFVATLKGYKTTNIQWEEVFQRLRPIFIPQKPELFISCSNILRSEDKMKYLKRQSK